MTRWKWLDVAVVVIPFALGVHLANGQETEDGGVAGGAVIRFLWLEPQGLTSAPYPPGTTWPSLPDHIRQAILTLVESVRLDRSATP